MPDQPSRISTDFQPTSTAIDSINLQQARKSRNEVQTMVPQYD